VPGQLSAGQLATSVPGQLLAGQLSTFVSALLAKATNAIKQAVNKIFLMTVFVLKVDKIDCLLFHIN
jgi:hypothetical protein